jgi:hypothetical protein
LKSITWYITTQTSYSNVIALTPRMLEGKIAAMVNVRSEDFIVVDVILQKIKICVL